MLTDTTPGVRALPEPCWTILLDDGTPAGFEECEPHYLSEEEARKAAPDYQREDEPPVKVVQMETRCWTATLLCGTEYVYDRGDTDSNHFADEHNLIVCIGESGLFPAEPGVFACDSETCPTCLPYAIPRRNNNIADAMVKLANTTLAFAQIERATLHRSADPDGLWRHETDTDHTVMLTLIACSLASEYFPQLNPGLIAQFAAVHDLPEVYANDTSTLRLPSMEQQATKEQKERSATWRLHAEYENAFPWLVYTLRSYQLQDTPEKVFVWAVDKLLPKLLHILNHGATVRAERATAAELAERYAIQNAQIRERAAQFPELADLHEILVGRMLAVLDDRPAWRTPRRPSCPVTSTPCPGNQHGQTCGKPCDPNGVEQ